MSSMAEWCAWCNKILKGKKSNFYGLCYKCRNSEEGKWHIKQLDKTASPIPPIAKAKGILGGFL